MAKTASWPVAVIITLAFAFIFLFEIIFEMLTERLFLSKIIEPSHANMRGSKLLLRIMSLPVGVLLDVVMARVDLDGTVMILFS